MKKRAKAYDKKLLLHESVQFDDLINAAMKPQKKEAHKAKRAGKKK